MTDTAAPDACADATPPMQSLHPITLTDAEQTLFAYLLQVRTHAQLDDAVELRVCGGWVRDKLLGRTCSDIDIALDRMSGRAFADAINAFDRTRGFHNRAIGVMRTRSDAATASEVATVHLGAVGKVDFASMRASLLCEQSDNVTAGQEFGTPLQDAQRRDFTINSLFYNLVTHQVEDWTYQGLDDLRSGILRTPQDARWMLLDDPMRAMRAVRFAAELGFTLDASLRAAIRLPDVQQALATTVSRQRMGQVVVATLAGPSARPTRALQLLCELQLLPSVLWPDTPELAAVLLPDGRSAPYVRSNSVACSSNDVWTRSGAYAAQMCALVALIEAAAAPLAAPAVQRTDSEQHERKLRLLAALLLPFVNHTVVKRETSVPTFMIRDALRLSNQDARDVDTRIFRQLPALQSLVRSDAFDRVGVAKLLRSLYPLWRVCRDVALVQELVDCAANDRQQQHITARYAAFTARIDASGLEDFCRRPPLLTGGDIIRQLGVAPGASVPLMLERVFEWHVEHSNASPSDAVAYFQSRTS